MRIKLPIDPISQNYIQNGYFYNQKGAKCYLDVNLQPELPLSRKVTIYYALSVGFGKEGIPLITIQQNGQAYCYRLPQELYDWTLNLVAMANMGENVFPAYIILSKQHEQWIANIM